MTYKNIRKKVYTMKRCPQCLGRGEVYCPVCRGSMKDPRNPSIKCTYCNGVGHVECTVCDGTGKIHDNNDYVRQPD